MKVQLSSVTAEGATEAQLREIREAFRICSETIHELNKLDGVDEVQIRVWYEERVMP